MKRVLVAGVTEYQQTEKLAKSYPEIIWIEAEHVYNLRDAQALIGLLAVIDEVVFVSITADERLTWEVACLMSGVPCFDVSKYPLDRPAENEVKQDESIPN